jgi:alpha-tubulin suppressor-like RCC1 family protein
VRGRVVEMAIVVAAAAGCGGGVELTSVAWVWAGSQDTCANTYDRHLWCWGSNARSRVGDGSLLDRNAPVMPAGAPTDVSFAAVGATDACAVTHGQLICWGASSGGNGSIIGQGTADTPNPQGVVMDAVGEVGVGNGWRCVEKVDGSAWCWGSADSGRLGDGTGADSAVPVAVASLSSGVVSLLAADGGTYVLKDDGSVWGWGFISVPNLVNSSAPTPVAVVGADGAPLAGVAQIGGNDTRICALEADSRIVCWGQIPQDTPDPLHTYADTPVEVDAGDPSVRTVEIVVGVDSLCRLNARGAVQCAGRNDNGQLGDGTLTRRFTMAPVQGLSGRVLHIAGGDAHVCAMLEDLTLWCWGANMQGQLGAGDTVDSPQPQRVMFQ